MKKALIVILIIGFSIQVVNGQNKVSGKLRDKDSVNLIEYASVSIIENNENKKNIASCFSDSLGYFHIDGIPSGTYILEVKHIGYDVIHIDFQVLNKDVDLGAIDIVHNPKMLEDIIVIGKKRSIVIKADKKIINIDDTNSAAGENAADVLQILPEIRVDNNNITLKNRNFSVLVNGKPSSMTMEHLFQMPASSIERIEVLTNPTAKYSPDGQGGIVNIIQKKRSSGINGIVQMTAGTDNSYNGAFTFNYGVNKLNFFTTFYPRYYNVKIDGNSSTEIYEENILTETYKKKQRLFNENFKIGFDYDLNDKNLFTFYWGQTFFQGRYRNDIKTQENDIKSEIISYESDKIKTKYHSRLNDLSFNYKHIFDTNKRELSIDFMQSFINNYENYKTSTQLLSNPYIYKITPDDATRKAVMNVEYITPLSEKHQINLDAGVNGTYVTEKYDNSGATFLQNVWVDSVDIRNTFKYKELLLSAYALVDFKINKLSFTVGGRVEYFKSELRQKTTRTNNEKVNFYPSLSVSFSPNDNNDLGFSYSRRIERPEAYQLNPFIYNGDYASEKYIGNASLKPSFSNSFEFSYTLDKGNWNVNGTLAYIDSKDVLDKTYYLDENIRYKTWGNISRNQSYMLNAGWYWNLNKFTMTLSGSIYNDSYSKENDGITQKDDYWTYDIRFVPKLALGKGYNVSAQLIYYGPKSYAYSKRTNIFRGSLTINKKIKDNLVISLRVNNLINKIPSYYSWGDGYSSRTYNDVNNQAVYIGILYKFGKSINSRAKTSLNTRAIQMQRDN